MDEIDIYFKQLEEYQEPIDIILDIDDIFKKVGRSSCFDAIS